MHKGLPHTTYHFVIKAHLALINRFLVLKFYDCLVFSRIINSYPLVAVFEFLGGSNYLDLCQLTLSTKKISATRPATAGRCCGGIFCPNFLDATLLPALLQKRSEIFLCYSFQDCVLLKKNSKQSTKQRIFSKYLREKLTIIAL